MAVNITDADAYIGLNVITTEDWTDADEAKKQRILNVASRTLTNRYSTYVIPDNAVYEFSAVLATAFNDTNVNGRNGVKSFSLSGVASFSFADGMDKPIEALIPAESIRLINEANPDLTPLKAGRTAKWTVL